MEKQQKYIASNICKPELQYIYGKLFDQSLRQKDYILILENKISKTSGIYTKLDTT